MLVKNHLASVRRERGLAAAGLAKRVGVSRQTIYAIESGNYVPNTAVALRLAHELEVPVEALFSLAEPEIPARPEATATLLQSMAKAAGRPVALGRLKGNLVAAPLDGAPYFLPEADGVAMGTSRMSSQVRVQVLSEAGEIEKRLFIAGCDPAIGLLARMTERLAGVQIVTIPATSRRALEWLRKGMVHVAGSHLEDPASGEFNVPYLRRLMPDGEYSVFTFARWEEGLVVAAKNPLGIRQAPDLARRGVRFVNRETGSGSRALLDSMLRKAGISAKQVNGYERMAVGHLAAAYAVASGSADCCVATPSAARAFGLDFVPLQAERFDFAVRREHLDMPAVRQLLDVLQRASLRRKLESLAGYDTSETGRAIA
ncbi:MAG: helix-turn-helix domain-containing protein [Bryobacteraceae bacterium]|nr:helix-turn-helix domain-containing protein [Bryobacteraceae bacterium]